ncbi:dephospho-CoA kinase [Vibrio palustris]|uniref:Dephospho-CoA kinase n=1 Tax=Vibrio palustris TaxID=1918946 RepID=A0A1R4B8Y0_9VIBR|nr:dephospho-CoA kinase [Vibrio palustris]SJL85372.1 Dephospho-CoA kinase [Vibrio palustris]
MALVIGVTGGISSGKSTVANLFHEHFAIDIVDADLVARDVVAPGTEGLAQIVEHFGEQILNHDHSLNRSRLRHCIFANEHEKQWLNHLLHPMIRQQMQAQLAQVTSPYALLVVPLLIENQLQSLVDRILVIDVPETIQIERTMQRDKVSAEQVSAILASQATREERLSHADDVICNHLLDNPLLPQVTQLHQTYLALSKQPEQSE